MNEKWNTRAYFCVDLFVYIYTVAQKNGTMFLYALTLSNINRFSKLFYCIKGSTIMHYTNSYYITLHYITVRIKRQFAIIQSLNIPSHLKCVATLPCEMSLSGANCFSISLIMPLVSCIASLNASSSSNMDTLNI